MAGNQAFARFNIVCGTNGTGKSTFVDKILKVTHFKNALVYIESIDQGGTPFKGLPVIDLFKYLGGKVCIDSDDIEFEEFINCVVATYRNGILIIDEAGMYDLIEKGGKPIPAITKLLKQRRKYNIEVYFLYHSASEVPVRLFKWCNNVILFHQTDKFGHKAGVIPRIDELNAAQERIRAAYMQCKCALTCTCGKRYTCERIQLS